MKIYFENEVDAFDQFLHLQQNLSRSFWEYDNLKEKFFEIQNERDVLLRVKLKNEREIETMRRKVVEIGNSRDEVLRAKVEMENELQTLREAVTQLENRQQNISESKHQERHSLTNELSAVKDSPTSPPPLPPPPPPSPIAFPIHNETATTKPTSPLPTINWLPLNINQVRGTIFNDLDYKKVHTKIDFTDFEARFRIVISEVDGSIRSRRQKASEFVLENTRLTNIGILLRKLNTPIEFAIDAINNLDLKRMPLEKVEILRKMTPTDQEVKEYANYAEKYDVNSLKAQDKFMFQLTMVDRISSKLFIMNYMGNFENGLRLINPKLHAIIRASNEVKSSPKFERILELVLAFGNHLNNGKKVTAYGFKLQSLDTLLDVKSTDKRSCLLHYIVATIRRQFSNLLTFDTELTSIGDAAQVSLENVITDVHELDMGMKTVRKEAEREDTIHVLSGFLNNSRVKFEKLKQEASEAQRVFKECAEYFGESSGTVATNDFFSTLVRFVKTVKMCDHENEKRRTLEDVAANKVKHRMK